VGRLIHEDAGPRDGKVLEVFHREEHDYVASSTGITRVRGQVPERFSEILDDDPVAYPRRAALDQYESAHLSGDIVVSAPLEQEGRAAQTTIVTQLSDHSETTRDQALADVTNAARDHAEADDLRSAASERVDIETTEQTPRSDVVMTDLRALSLLTAPSGARIAGPDFDPFYANSGGYGYTWFRDDAEISSYLFEAGDKLDLDVDDQIVESARFYCETQLDDGSWPHRVWASDGSLAPGWAHAHVEGSDKPEYQADQTASVTSFLATLLRDRRDRLDSEDRAAITDAIRAAVESLDDSLEDDGLPEPCQNLWENMNGRFTHTAATFLEAYAAVAKAPLDDEFRDHASSQAERVLDGLDALWDEEHEHYGLRLHSGTLDSRIDSASLSLVSAFEEYAELTDLPEKHLDRLVDHVDESLDVLYREADDPTIAGLVRFEEDYWRSREQDDEKLWSVSTSLGAASAAQLGRLLDSEGRVADSKQFLDWAGDLYELLLPGGPFCTNVGYLAEQVFDDGTPDSAAPLGWSHAVRLYTTALLRDLGALPAPTSAPSGPGSRPRWTTGEKYGFGTVADHGQEGASKTWFTLTEGALTELRYPRIDVMNVRTLDFLIVGADEDETYTARAHNETRRDDHADTIERSAEIVQDDALVFQHTIEETGDGRGHEWTLTAEYAADPEHDAVVSDVSFEAADDNEYEVYVVADTALANTGDRDRGFRLGQEGEYHLAAHDVQSYDEDPLFTEEEGESLNVALALTTNGKFDWATVGVAGTEHLRELFSRGKAPDPAEEAHNENLVLVGRLGTGEAVEEAVGVGFAEDADTVGALGEAEGALTRGYETVRSEYVGSWQSFLDEQPVPDIVEADDELEAQYNTALMVLQGVEDKTYHGAGIASPSVPWGESVVADDAKSYGYNFVWSRDLYQVFTVWQLLGDVETAHEELAYIYEYQQDDHGFIPQNTYLHGRTRWGGEQMDNISFPQVMAYHLAQEGVDFEQADYDYVNVKRSADYVSRNGPHSAQERWEEESGFSPSSIAAEIAGLACAGKLALDEGIVGDALVYLALADDWTENVENLTATSTGTKSSTDTPYYVRLTRDGDPDAGKMRTLANEGPTLDEREIIDAGFLELVRLGIKPWDDDVIQNSVDVVDDTILVETPNGPCFYRYNGDGYGERSRNEEGGPWSLGAQGKGRLWPIFTGERGEYELFADQDERAFDPEFMLESMAEFSNSGRMIPEQVWDREHSTQYNWEFGEGTGSATPLAWSMAQFVRLAHGIDEGEPAETPDFVYERYVERDTPDGPSLQVGTSFEEDHLVVTVETDGDLVAIKTPSETVHVEPTSGRFVVRVDIEYGENDVIVAAASDEDLESAGTTVDRLQL
jgi:glucan 1,4-alpha-glucosidase